VKIDKQKMKRKGHLAVDTGRTLENLPAKAIHNLYRKYSKTKI